MFVQQDGDASICGDTRYICAKAAFNELIVHRKGSTLGPSGRLCGQSCFLSPQSFPPRLSLPQPVRLSRQLLLAPLPLNFLLLLYQLLPPRLPRSLLLAPLPRGGLPLHFQPLPFLLPARLFCRTSRHTLRDDSLHLFHPTAQAVQFRPRFGFLIHCRWDWHSSGGVSRLLCRRW
jgi:hypothetical protein